MAPIRSAVAFLLLAALFAGCAQKDVVDETTSQAPPATSLLAGPALWEDPQNTPHPAYNWATLSHPPAGQDLPYWWQPIEATPLPAQITGIEHIATADNVSAGAGISVFGRVAVTPDFGGSVHFVDISDPTKTAAIGKVESSGRGAAIIAYPDGRLVTAVSTGSGFDVIEFTDPKNPVRLAEVEPSQGGHKLGVVPGTPIVYNAASNGGGTASACRSDISQCQGYTEIYDLSDPAVPVLVQEFPNGLSCHHVFFWNNLTEGKFRAICAGIEYTQLWDTKDPLNPTVIASIPVHSGQQGTPSQEIPIVAFSHSAGLSMDGSVLYVGDEMGGGGVPPGCLAGVTVPVGSAGTPVGATWFYDVTVETDSRLLGYYSPLNDPLVKPLARSCTTHHGRLVPDAGGRDVLAMSYYGAGVVLLDFTGIGEPNGPLPHAIAQYAENSNTWETAYYQGYLFTGDLARGMETFKLT